MNNEDAADDDGKAERAAVYCEKRCGSEKLAAALAAAAAAANGMIAWGWW